MGKKKVSKKTQKKPSKKTSKQKANKTSKELFDPLNTIGQNNSQLIVDQDHDKQDIKEKRIERAKIHGKNLKTVSINNRREVIKYAKEKTNMILIGGTCENCIALAWLAGLHNGGREFRETFNIDCMKYSSNDKQSRDDRYLEDIEYIKFKGFDIYKYINIQRDEKIRGSISTYDEEHYSLRLKTLYIDVSYLDDLDKLLKDTITLLIMPPDHAGFKPLILIRIDNVDSISKRLQRIIKDQEGFKLITIKKTINKDKLKKGGKSIYKPQVEDEILRPLLKDHYIGQPKSKKLNYKEIAIEAHVKMIKEYGKKYYKVSALRIMISKVKIAMEKETQKS